MNRSDLIDQLSASVNQAPIDVNRYINFALSSILYDKSARTYVCGTNFKPLHTEPDSSKDLAQLRPNADGTLNREDSWIANLPQYADTPTPVRGINPLTLYSAAGAIRQLEVKAKVTALDYGMRNGKERIKARQALLLYALKRLGLDTATEARALGGRQIVLINRDAVTVGIQHGLPELCIVDSRFDEGAGRGTKN